MPRVLELPEFYKVTAHTDFVGPGSTFVATRGARLNGEQFIVAALKKGAAKIVVADDAELDRDVVKQIEQHEAELVRVKNTRKALAELAAQAYDYPAKKLNILGVTGTKGKTTTTHLLAHLCATQGKTALMSSVLNRVGDRSITALLSTPLPDYLHWFLHECVQDGVTWVVMEVTAQALSLCRVAGIDFAGIVFTNFDREHAEFYPTMEEYFAAKLKIFAHRASNAPMLVNADDRYGQDILTSIPQAVGYSLQKTDVRWVARVVSDDHCCLRVAVNDWLMNVPHLGGPFNAYNIVAAFSLAMELGFDPKNSIDALHNFPGVCGRLEKHVLPNGALCYIDHAHNPSSYHAVLSYLRERAKHLIVVFGCGGGRDQGKRPIMGDIASQYADQVIVTSDNPRGEDPAKIIEDVCSGITPKNQHKLIKELSRKRAIELACQLSHAGSVIALLGKGQERYNVVGEKKTYFSEPEIVATCAQQMDNLYKST